MRLNSRTFVVAMMLWSTTVPAEQLYVEDKLVLNVYAEASSSSSRVATIETGDAVEALERVENFVRVQLADGREGWVGANYLSDQPPAIVRLKELESASGALPSEPPKRLTDEIARLKKQNTTLQHELAESRKKLSAAPPALPANASAVPAAHVDVEPLAPPAREPTIVIDRSYWWAWMLAALAAGALGFYAGYQTLGRRVRERFGGVKVY